MSGHSKWETIKRKKAITDAARAKKFTKVSRMITVAAQNGGGDPDMNPSLALAIEKAKSINMPNENIERAIKKGMGEVSSGSKIEEITYEAYGPGNVALIIDCLTDNKNRTVSELRSIIEKNGGKLAETGSVLWQFRQIGRILLEFQNSDDPKNETKQKWSQKEETRKITKRESDNFQLEIFDLPGIIDVIVDDNGLEIRCEYSELNNIRKYIENKKIQISESSLIRESTAPIEVDDLTRQKIEKLTELVAQLDDVQEVWTNLKQN